MRYDGPIVDVDIHHQWSNEDEVVAYLPDKWKAFVTRQRSASQGSDIWSGNPSPIMPPPSESASGIFQQNRSTRLSALPTDGSLPGSDYGLLCEQLLDRYNYFRGILTHQVGHFGTHLNPYWAAAVCRAVNDWNVDTWLKLDERLYSVIVVAAALPDVAAEEIRRLGGHPRMVSVLLAGNPIGRPFGDPLYDPIYKAAAEMGLSIALHPGPDRPNGQIAHIGGPTTTGIDSGGLLSQQAMHYISSFIAHGVFEKYPDLKVIIKEWGVAWLPSLMWRLDENYEILKLESPWVKRWPSDYIRGHIRLSTQPMEESPVSRTGLADLLQTVDGIEDLLCFSTDFPHITSDDPAYVAKLLPARWLRKVFCDNACALYGWIPPAHRESAQRLGAGRA